MSYDLPPGAHDRWALRCHRDPGESDYPDAWYLEQCGSCRSWIPLSAPAGLDWGVCTSEVSTFDGVVRFEHDGCAAFEDSGSWRSPSG